MIRQAISCDICGAEKRQTNHWFVAHVQAGELRISGWTAQGKLRAGSKHLCGQTCLHKLVDEFMAGVARSTQPDSVVVDESLAGIDAGLTSNAAYGGGAVPARALPLPPFEARPMPAVAGPVFTLPAVRNVDEPHIPNPTRTLAEMPAYGSRHWRAEAWKRERERESRNGVGGRRTNG